MIHHKSEVFYNYFSVDIGILWCEYTVLFSLVHGVYVVNMQEL